MHRDLRPTSELAPPRTPEISGRSKIALLINAEPLPAIRTIPFGSSGRNLLQTHALEVKPLAIALQRKLARLVQPQQPISKPIGPATALTSSFSHAIIVPKLTRLQRQYVGSSGSTSAQSGSSVSAARRSAVAAAAPATPFCAPPRALRLGAALRVPTETVRLPSSSAVTRPGVGRRARRAARGASVSATSTTLARRSSRSSRGSALRDGGSADAALPDALGRLGCARALAPLPVSLGVEGRASALADPRRERDTAAVAGVGVPTRRFGSGGETVGVPVRREAALELFGDEDAPVGASGICTVMVAVWALGGEDDRPAGPGASLGAIFTALDSPILSFFGPGDSGPLGETPLASVAADCLSESRFRLRADFGSSRE